MGRILLAIAFAAIIAGCELLLLPSPTAQPSDGGRFCTMIGCENGVTFRVDVDLLPEVAYDVEACFDGRCERQVLRVPPPTDGPFTGASAGNLSIDTLADTIRLRIGEGSFEGSHEVRIVILEAGEPLVEATVTAELTATQPNGPGCEPVCWGAEVRV